MNISVIVPYYNESLTLKKTLESLSNQTQVPYEIIMVDSGSTDESTLIIQDFINDNKNVNINIIYSGKMTPSSSINLGINKSSCSLIAYIDCGLDIPRNWLESHLKLLIEKDIDIISPRVFTDGKELIDKGFISHTMGFMSYTPCFTGSLLKKTIIEDLNYLLSDARASYDVDFINKIESIDAKRLINTDITLRYFGTNYSNSVLGGILKISKYSENAWRVKNHLKPYIYIFSLLLAIVSFNYGYGSIIILLYFLIRGYMLPLYRSSSNIFKELKLLIILPFVGAIIDISRIIGYLFIHKIFRVRWE